MSKQYISYYDGTRKDADSVELATKDYAGLMSKEDKAKLDSIVVGSNGSISSVEADKIVQDANHRFVTDVQITAWNSKSNNTIASTTSDGLLSKEDKAKLDAIEAGANNYVHPDKHAATMITEDAVHRFVTDVEKTRWNAKADNTVASTTTAGLMSAADKIKLDGITEGGGGSNVQASAIIEDDDHKFVTTEQLQKINDLPTGYEINYDDTDQSVSIIPSN